MEMFMKFWIAVLILVLGETTLSDAQGTTCSDLISVGTCQYIARVKACRSEALKARMAKFCRRTCKFCSVQPQCEAMRCASLNKCRLTVDKNDRCQCALTCSYEQKTGLLCGSNGKTYKNLCKLKEDECNSNRDIIVQHYGKCIKEEVCMDVSRSECDKFMEDGYCEKQKTMMQFFCAKTCRLCRQPPPLPSCAKSKYGCCWNSNKAASGRNQKGCKACRDKKFCRQFIPECGEEKNRAVMRQLCPASCGYC